MMRCFETFAGIAAPLPLTNIDTDKILAGQYLKTISREGLGSKLFSSMRYRADGTEDPPFILNKEPWRNSKILITLDNFGCGSSREHAPWALVDFGIRCIIAPSFADIFYNNCFKNGILPVILPDDVVEDLLAIAGNPDSCVLYVDLTEQKIILSDGRALSFDIAPERKTALLEGSDEISRSLEALPTIERWEARYRFAPDIPMDIGRLG